MQQRRKYASEIRTSNFNIIPCVQLSKYYIFLCSALTKQLLTHSEVSEREIFAFTLRYMPFHFILLFRFTQSEEKEERKWDVLLLCRKFVKQKKTMREHSKKSASLFLWVERRNATYIYEIYMHMKNIAKNKMKLKRKTKYEKHKRTHLLQSEKVFVQAEVTCDCIKSIKEILFFCLCALVVFGTKKSSHFIYNIYKNHWNVQFTHVFLFLRNHFFCERKGVKQAKIATGNTCIICTGATINFASVRCL